jgi:hypothetical protein
MIRSHILLLLFILIFPLAACAEEKAASTVAATEQYRCASDSDCVPVGDCCQHTTAVHKDQQATWQEQNRPGQNCDLVRCMKPTGTAACVKQTCTLQTETPTSSAPPSDWDLCTTDTDCTPIGTECCDANFTRAVNVKYADAWRQANPRHECKPDTMCIMMVKTATCQQGRCTVAPTNTVSE